MTVGETNQSRFAADLIKQWDEYIESMGSVMGEVEHMAQQMRDRIEELERYCAAYAKADRMAVDHINTIEAKLAKAVEALRECQAEIDQYIWQEYPSDHPLHERYRKRDLSANAARIALAELEGK